MSDRPLAPLGAHQAKPSADFLFHGGLLLSIETTQPTDQLYHGYGHKALSIESAWSEEPNAEGHLEAGAAQAGGVGNERDKGPIRVFNRHAQHERGPDLRSEAQVDKPDLAPLR